MTGALTITRLVSSHHAHSSIFHLIVVVRGLLLEVLVLVLIVVLVFSWDVLLGLRKVDVLATGASAAGEDVLAADLFHVVIVFFFGFGSVSCVRVKLRA